jgi:hypothetical protein
VSALEILKAARAAGIELALDGDDLALSAASAPPPGVLDGTRPRSRRCSGPAGTAGRARTGWPSSMNGRALARSMAGCRVGRPRDEPSSAAWSNG